MPTVAIVGDRSPTTELLREGLGAAGLRCRTIGEVGEERVSAPLDGTDAVVYLAACRGERGVPDLADAATWLRRCRDLALTQVVVISSAQIHEPSMRHPGLVAEDRRLPGSSHPIASRWRELEDLAATLFDGRTTNLTVLRPTAVPVPGGADFFSRLLDGRLAVTLPGHDPMLQLLSVEDLAGAVAAAIGTRGGGVFHAAPRQAVSLRSALKERGVRRWPVPRTLQIPFRALFARLGLVDPIAQLDYIRYDWTVSAAKADRELGLGAGAGGGSTPGGADHTDDGNDPFGADRAYVDALGRRLLRFLHDVYWRVELAGLEHVPTEGPVILVGVHRGTFPWDGMMIVHALATRTGRYPRFLVHPGLLKFPFFFNLFRKMGGLLACQENSSYVLAGGGALAVFPEGVDGAFRLYRDAYRLGRFGRGGFVKAALRSGAPIVPFVTVGSAEASPVLAKITSNWWRRYALWPCIPITPTILPLPLPLPSKWHTRFLPPLKLDVADPSIAARDHAFVQETTRAIHSLMQAELDDILARRPSVFAGDVFDR